PLVGDLRRGLSRGDDRCAPVAAGARRVDAPPRFLPDRESAVRDRIRAVAPPALGARAASRHSPCSSQARGGRVRALPHEGYAVIEGRHPDPFHYLGWHMEAETPTVRAFLPNASEVAAIDEEGHTTMLPRVHDAGLFEGHLQSRRPRYRLRARYGDHVGEMEDPYRFPPVLSDF